MSGDDAKARDVLIRVIVIYVVAYAAFAAFGAHIFIFKSVLVPAFAIYAVWGGAPSLFVRAWFPFLASTVCFDALRGAIFTVVQLGYRPIFWDYPIRLEQALFGTPAVCIPLQQHARSDLMDRIMVMLHGAHFVYFLMFGLVVWHVRRELFASYKWAMIGTFYSGGLFYLVFPTAPPWLAAFYGLIPPVEHVAGLIYNVAVPQLVGAFDTNPVAAMPSLHAAFPTTCMILAWRAFPRLWGIAATVYTLGVSFAIVYLGEHYLVDVLGGYLLAAAVCIAVFKLNPPGEPPALRDALGRSALLILAAILLALLAGY
jgi:membrane-associated phospholipid phosphatase